MTEEERLVRECFDSGAVGEYCDDCIAHPDNDPPDFECCFGTKHEYNDDVCRRCDHSLKCSRLTHGRSPRRVLVRSRQKPSTSNSLQIRSDPAKALLPDVVQTPSNRTPVQVRQEEEEEPFVNRLLRVTGWGMIEGGLQMALSHFQKNRPK